MKPQTYLRLSLLLPYLLWGMALVLAQAYGGSENPSPVDKIIPLDVSWLLSLYVIGAIFWFIPYTLLALGLLIWSLGKQVRAIMRMFALSPVMLTVLIVLEINLVSILTLEPSSQFATADLKDLLAFNVFAIGLTIAASYLCVGIGFGLYKALQQINVIRENRAEPQPLVAEA